MRQCRGKTKDGKEVKGYLVEFKDLSIIFPAGDSLLISKDSNKDYSYIASDFWVEVIPESVGQDTGMKDKNDKPIFGSLEGTKGGDNCEVELADGRKMQATVGFNDGCFDLMFQEAIHYGQYRDYLKCYTVNHAVEVIAPAFEEAK